MCRYLFTLLVCLIFCAKLSATETCRYTVIENPYTFSTYYELIGNDRYEGRVIKNALSVRTIYDLYDSSGDYDGQGICRLLSLGAVFPCAREIDIYDSNDQKIGMIDGKVITLARTKYNLYGANDQLVGVAYNNDDASGFTIVDPSRNERLIAHCKRNPSDWEIAIYDQNTIDMRILKIFSAFLVDYQDYF